MSKLDPMVLRVLPISILPLLMAGCVESDWTVCRDGRICSPDSVCDTVNHTCSTPGDDCLAAADGIACADGARVCLGGHCVSSCGDGVLNGRDECEGSDFGDRTCIDDYQTYGGELACDDSCRIDSSGCSGACRDGHLDEDHESCDPTDFDPAGAASCFALGLDAGRQACADDCSGLTSGTCMKFGWSLESPAQPGTAIGSIGDIWGTGDSLFAIIQAGVVRTTAEGGQGWDLVGGDDDLARGTALWASSARDIWVLGIDGDNLAHWDGSRWSVVAAPVRGLIEIWGSSASDVFAVGREGVIHFDGARWSAQRTPGSARLQAIWGVGPDEVYAAGEDGHLVRYDGRRWSAIDSGTTEDLAGIWAASSSEIWTVSGSSVRRFDGQRWRVMLSFEEELNGRGWIAATGANDLWVSVGPRGDVWRYDGSSWSLLLEGHSDGAQPLWVDGRATAVAARDLDDEGAVRRWFGAGTGPTLAPDGDWFDAWAIERDQWIAVGSVRGTGEGVALHSDGATYSFDENLNQVTGFAGGRGFAAGSGGTIYEWDGATWSLVHAEPGARFIDLWTAGSTDVYAMTSEDAAPSRIVHFDGQSWIDLPAIEPPCGLGVGTEGWASSAEDVWVVGNDLLAHFDGSAWTCHDGAEGNQPFLSVWGSGPGDVWVFQGLGGDDDDARLRHWDGAAWSSQVTTGFGHLVGTASDDVFLGSEAHFDGRVWSPIRSSALPGDVVAASPSRLLMTNVIFEVGGLGQFVRTRFWNQRASETGCSDGVDDDDDGLTDGDDSDCQARGRRGR
ncbi:MAG TPA: hypothetical protein VK698_23170 [Kofleriaceae bacterium]|nr:hypothetical protein [Kofleriaceae bacterium]